MRRTLAATVVPCLVIGELWLRLERPHDGGAALLVGALALAPALVRPLRLRLAATVFAILAAAALAYRISPLRHPGAIAARFGDGFLGFYDVPVPFDPRLHATMDAAILTAIFGFCLAVSLAVAARRAGLAVLALLVGAGWPATLVTGGSELARGAVILVAALVLLVALARRPAARAAVPAAIALALVAGVASTSPAIAKHELVAWRQWDPYTPPDKPVAVSFVWDSQYGGLHWPKKRTVVLRIQAPSRSLYWRATTLDTYVDDHWVERDAPSGVAADGIDPLLPRAAHDSNRLVEAKVTVAALADDHLVAASEPVRFDVGGLPLLRPQYGVAEIAGGLTRGFTYTAYSYAARPTPEELLRSKPVYPRVLTKPGGYLDVEPGIPAPAFGSADRAARLEALLEGNPIFQFYRPLEQAAVRVAGRARTPYAAAVSLESWFRFRGGFVYDDRPPVPASVPPLVGFVAQTKEGYCQYFAGAMALMLRYLGVPARVAVGFTSGTYDASKHEWTVTDHDAHAWVEAWFRGYGWLPFDPTPGRGHLSATYSAGSPGFLSSAGKKLAAALGVLTQADVALNGNFREPGGRARTGLAGDVPFAAPPATSHGSRGGSLLALLALVAACAVVAVALAKLVRRHVRYLSRDPRRVASACRRELADYLLDQRIEAARSATLQELGELVRDELAVDPSDFVAAASAARFGPPAGAPVSARRARRELRALERSLRRALTWKERARGLVSLRSLGVTTS